MVYLITTVLRLRIIRVKKFLSNTETNFESRQVFNVEGYNFKSKSLRIKS